MKPSGIKAIDVHGHIGTYKGAMQKPSLIADKMMSGSYATVVKRAMLANTQITIVSHLKALLPRFHGNPIHGNKILFNEIRNYPQLMMWVVVNPLQPDTYKQAKEMLKSHKCAGIKIHPEEHGYPIKKYGMKIFEFAEENNAVVETHSGEKNSMPEDFLKFANDFPTVKLIVSHLGCGWDRCFTHQINTIAKSKHGNIYTDTSSAMSIFSGLLEYAVSEIGAEHILYGTDTPLYFAPMQRSRIDNADINSKAKEMILCTNALRLFKLGANNENNWTRHNFSRAEKHI